MGIFPSGRRALFLSAFGLIAFSNLASAEDVISCRSFAEAAADEWAGGRIVPIDRGDTGNADQLVVISYGHKYLMPRQIPNNGSVIVQGLGTFAKQRNQIYEEELARCLRPREFKVKVYTK